MKVKNLILFRNIAFILILIGIPLASYYSKYHKILGIIGALSAGIGIVAIISILIYLKVKKINLSKTKKKKSLFWGLIIWVLALFFGASIAYFEWGTTETVILRIPNDVFGLIIALCAAFILCVAFYYRVLKKK